MICLVLLRTKYLDHAYFSGDPVVRKKERILRIHGDFKRRHSSASD